MILADILEVLFLGAALLVVGYLLTLTILAARAQIRTRFAAQHTMKFAFVIPAHDEEGGIGDTVASVRSVEYPRDRFDVVVIADNCTDATAERARAAGANVLERHDPLARGKGYALRWGFDRLLSSPAGYDALIVVDADSVVTANYLSVLNWYLEQGARAVQTSDLVTPDVRSWNAQMTRIGFLLYNYVRPLGRNALGGSSGLRGNGMCFSADILRRFPWDAFSVAEDLEYGIHLLLKGVTVTFAPEAAVYATMPEIPANAESQRARWEGGRFGLVRRYTLPLLRGLSAAGSLACLDAFFDLLTPALVNLIGACFLAALTSWILLLCGDGRAIAYAALWMLAAACGFVHLFAGLRIAHADRAVYRAMANLPRFAFWKLGVYLRMPGRWSRSIWTRTTREAP